MKDRSLPRVAAPVLALALVAVLAAVQALAGSNAASAPDPVLAEPSAPLPEQGKVNRFIGAQKCKSCHDKEETGNQHAQWLDSKHAKAFQVLASDAAKAIATEKGLGDPQKEAACVKCHQTAHGVPAAQLQKGFDPTAGVQCETCHGPGEAHMMARMKAAAAKTTGYPTIPEGEIVTMPTEESCRACHNPESPTFKPFCPHERMEEIKHWNPKKPRTEEQKKGYACSCDETCVCRKDEAEHKCRSGKGAPESKEKAKEEVKEGAK